MPEFRLTVDAANDLNDIFLYSIQAFGESLADRYRQSLIDCFKLLAENPGLGRSVDEFAPGARRHEHQRHVIFYDEQAYGVLILALIHDRSVRHLFF